MRGTDQTRNRLLGLIATILVVWALRVSYPVTMPLAASMLLMAAVWPLKIWFDRGISKLSYLATGLVLLCILALFFAALYFSASQIVQAFGDNWGKLESVYQVAVHWLGRWGISDIGSNDRSRLIGVGQDILANASTILIYLGFIALLVVLGLPQVVELRTKLDRHLSTNETGEIAGTIDEIARKVRQYLGITLLTSLLTGAASALWALTLGLDLPLVWGILNFLLNFIPVVGNFAGIIPPTLYALIQFQTLSGVLMTLAGFSVIQIVISNFIYPMLQGRSLSLSPIAVVLALSFWSWVWGLAGAFIAIPLTVSLVIICGQFDSTRWFALLVSSGTDEPGQQN